LNRKGEQIYVETPDGDMLPAYEFDAKDVLKGCELLGKHLGMFVEKHEVYGKDGGAIEVNRNGEIEERLRNDPEARELLKQLYRRTGTI